MSALDQVIEYLHTKISRVNLNNQKANTGGALIKTYSGWEDKLDLIVVRTMQLIQSQFTRKHPDYPAGEAALTATSMTIGKHIAPLISREPIDMKHQLALGDILIEGFAYHGFVELVSPERYSHKGYILKAAPKWAELQDIPDELIAKTIIGSHLEPQGVSNKIHKTHEELYNSDAAYVTAVSKLQNVGWNINTQVLDTICANKHKFIHDEPFTDNPEKEQRRISKIIEWRFVTRKAAVLRELDSFYQTFEVDYRGRIYNVEPFLNFQSNDVAKGLLQFSTPQEITPEGEEWLAIHTATSYNQSYHKSEIPEWCQSDYLTHLEEEGLEDISVDKMTLKDRAQWTYQNADRIVQLAKDNELDMKAEKPVTFLACCYEWLYVENTGLTCIPVAIDGSNNGWQHLGAISKDAETGKLVGLVPVKIQQDFYVQTAKELINQTTDDRLISILSSMPMKHIRKGISKRGSMTRAYSAGAGKIADNMYFDCKTEDFHEKYGITKKDCKKFASKLVKSIEVVCPGPLQTMKYLQDLAAYQLGKHELVGGTKQEYSALKGRRKELLSIKDKDITDEELIELNDVSARLNEFNYELVYGVGDEYIEWSTPSGFHAKYEKFTMSDIQLKATLNGKRISHKLNIPTDRPDVRGFMCGISPNYIHSMDAAHMALVIADWDGDFGAVHDSFATHANQVPDLLQRTKDVFIEMYDHDNYFDVIRENLTNNQDDVEQPALGTLDIGGINDSEYFFA